MPADRPEWEERLLADEKLLGLIAGSIGGAFHVMYPPRIIENIKAFQQVFERKGVVGAIYYGKKANKAACVVAACRAAGAGVDVASAGEFESARAGGIPGEELVVTGPVKSAALLRTAVRHNALIAVDSLDELARLRAVAVDNAVTARILMRVLPPGSHSRFGMTGDELDLALTLADPESIRLEGFSFHLSGYEVTARAELAAALLTRCRAARGLGHPVTTISIGGGFGVNYVAADAWEAFRDGVNPRWFHGDRAPGSYYPYHCPVPGAAMLEAILDHNDLANQLRANGIRLAIEPGRALLDKAGCSVFQVQGVKTRTAHGKPYAILTVSGTSLSISEQWFASEYLPDPVLWPRRRGGTVTPTCVGGSTCLDDDMLSWRRIPLPRPAATEDLLIYPNTAGYQMDSNESAFHELPIPDKVVLRPGEQHFEWELDAPAPSA